MSLRRGLDILEYMALHGAPCSLNYLSEELRIPRTSCFRILKELEERGYIQLAERIGREQQWRLTYKLSIFGDLVFEENNLQKVSQPFMRTLAEATDLFVQLGVFSNNRVLYIDEVKRSQTLRVYAPKWSYLDIHTCAAGLVLAAYMEHEKVKKIIAEQGLSKRTASTIVTKKEFFAKLEKVRKQRYAIDKEYYAEGIKCIAAPIFDHQNQCIAAVGVTGHSSEFSALSFLVEQVQKCAIDISEQMQYGTNLIKDRK